jgi:hypothetical protein
LRRRLETGRRRRVWAGRLTTRQQTWLDPARRLGHNGMPTETEIR